MSKPIIYIASPYTNGDSAINTFCQMRAFHELMDDGLVWPVVPLMSHFLHLQHPRPYRDWIDYDLALLDRYDACLRINASYPEMDYLVTESSGADGEVKRFVEMGRPVFYSKAALYEWLRPARVTPSAMIALCGYPRCGKDTAGEALVVDGWERRCMGDIIKRQVDELCKGQLGFSAFTERDSQKETIRPMLEHWGDANYDNIVAEYFNTLPAGPVVNTRLCREREAIEWKKRGGKIVEILRPGTFAKTDWEENTLARLRDGYVDIAIDNYGTIENLHHAIRRVAASLCNPNPRYATSGSIFPGSRQELDERTEPGSGPQPMPTASPPAPGLPLCKTAALSDCSGVLVETDHCDCGER